MNNALGLAVGYIELLVDDERLPADARESAEEALQAALDASKLLDELEQIEKIEKIEIVQDRAVSGGIIDLGRGAVLES